MSSAARSATKRGAANGSRSRRASELAEQREVAHRRSTARMTRRTRRRHQPPIPASTASAAANGHGPHHRAAHPTPLTMTALTATAATRGRTARPAARGAAAPGRQRLGVQPGPDVVAEQRQLLAQIERGRSSATAACRARISATGAGARSHARQRLLAGARARRAEQLEQRAGAEEVEIAGVRMRRVDEALAGLAAARPAILEPRQAALVERHGAVGALPGADDRVVPEHQRHEAHHRQGDPPRRQPVPIERRHRHDHTGEKHCHARGRDAAFQPRQRLRRSAPCVETAPVVGYYTTAINLRSLLHEPHRLRSTRESQRGAGGRLTHIGASSTGTHAPGCKSIEHRAPVRVVTACAAHSWAYGTLAMAVRLSVIIPVYNGAAFLDRALASLRQSTFRDFECIVVDDGSTDDTAAVATRYGVTLLRLDPRGGPAGARNHGAARARGAVLLFLDADVCVHTDTLALVDAHLRAHPGTDALLGSYDDTPADPHFVSQYKNLFHHYVHQVSRSEAWTFWAGCGAIRRTVFETVGGFDETYVRPSIEDIELGARLRAQGHRIDLNARIQVTHLKRWTLRTLVRTDVLDRGVPWLLLMLRTGKMPPDLNVTVRHRLSVLLVCALVLLSGGALIAYTVNLPFDRGGWLPSPLSTALVAVLLAVTVTAMNRDLYRFFTASADHCSPPGACRCTGCTTVTAAPRWSSHWRRTCAAS